jgi:hypothetical protein
MLSIAVNSFFNFASCWVYFTQILVKYCMYVPTQYTNICNVNECRSF